jgi:hypothetical protein
MQIQLEVLKPQLTAINSIGREVRHCHSTSNLQIAVQSEGPSNIMKQTSCLADQRRIIARLAKGVEYTCIETYLRSRVVCNRRYD